MRHELPLCRQCGHDMANILGLKYLYQEAAIDASNGSSHSLGSLVAVACCGRIGIHMTAEGCGGMKYLEDFHPGQRIAFGSHLVAKDAIVGFAEAFDPQVFHTDDTHRVTQELGGLMASGWHTAAIFMRLAVEAYLEQSAVLTSPGVDELRWLAPVRPGDTISGEAVVKEARQSASRPDRGILTTHVRLWNQDGVDVLTMKTHAFVRVRPH